MRDSCAQMTHLAPTGETPEAFNVRQCPLILSVELQVMHSNANRTLRTHLYV